MPQERTRKIVVTAVLGAIAIFLGWSRWGFLPWFSGISITIMHIPAIIGAILEGPIVGFAIGLIFGLFSMVQASMPNNPGDILFTNPLISVLPRLFIGPAAWLIWNTIKKWPVPGLIASGIAGSLTNTILVLGMIGVIGGLPWALIPAIIVSNGFPEAGVSAVIVLAVISAWWRIPTKKKAGSSLGLNIERSLVLIKPDGVRRGLVGEMITRLEKRSLKIIAAKFILPTRDLAEKHYKIHAGKPFYEGLLRYITSSPVLVMVWEGPNAIAAIRQTMEANRLIEADPGTIRHDLELAKGRNLTHASDSPSSAEKEIDLWFSANEIISWDNSTDPWVWSKN